MSKNSITYDPNDSESKRVFKLMTKAEDFASCISMFNTQLDKLLAVSETSEELDSGTLNQVADTFAQICFELSINPNDID